MEYTRFLTHKEIETMCDNFMKDAGWERAQEKKLNKALVEIRADRLYFKENEDPLAFEIKPENAQPPEIKRGIGQCATCLPCQVKPYLVLSRKQWAAFVDIIAFLPWLGILVYPASTSEKNFRHEEMIIKQKSNYYPSDPPKLKKHNGEIHQSNSLYTNY